MITVSNTSPLLSLARIDRLDLLEAISESVVIPQAVHEEIMVRRERRDAQAIAGARWIQVNLVKNRRAVTSLIKTTGLDLGESEALVLAQQLKADRIVLDDLAARRVAQRKRMPLIGTLGLILTAKKLHLITTVKPLMNDLIATGKYVDPVTYREVLALAGER